MTDAEIIEVVAQRMAVVLGLPATTTVPARVTEAAAASVALVRWYLYGDIPPPVTDPPTPPPDLPPGEDMLVGYTALGVRVYHDPASPGGVVGGDAFTGQAIPEDLLAHVHHYFNRAKVSWGMA